MTGPNGCHRHERVIHGTRTDRSGRSHSAADPPTAGLSLTTTASRTQVDGDRAADGGRRLLEQPGEGPGGRRPTEGAQGRAQAAGRGDQGGRRPGRAGRNGRGRRRVWRPKCPANSSGWSRLLDELEIKALLSGPLDANAALLTINARDGGTDANDWAEMLLRMYLNWAEKTTTTTPNCSTGRTTKRRASTAPRIAVRGPMAYGYLKGESGIHRLVRISPFNAEGKRQTSFAAVDVSPEVSEHGRHRDPRRGHPRRRVPRQRRRRAARQQDLQRDPADPPSHGIVVQCQSERSQHKNRATALKMLRARLARIEEEKREAEQAAKYNQMPKVGLRLADPQLLPASRPARQGRPHRLRHGQLPQRAGRQHPGVSRRLFAVAGDGEWEVGETEVS